MSQDCNNVRVAPRVKSCCGSSMRRWWGISFFLGLMALTLVMPLGCNPSGPQADVIVLHTGRLRGNVYPAGVEHLAPLQYYPYIAGYVRQVREEAEANGAQVVLVDLGDSLKGSFAAHTTNSGNIVDFFNALDYDVISLSNLDSQVDPELVSKLEAEVLSPFSSNQGEPVPEGAKHEITLQKGEHAVSIQPNFYGPVDPASKPEQFPTKFGGSDELVAPLREYQEKPGSTLSLLTWMKMENPGRPPQAFLGYLAEQGIDGILAHRIYGPELTDAWAVRSDSAWEPPVALNILRANRGFTVSRSDFKKTRGGWKLIAHEIVPMTANRVDPDPAMSAHLKKHAAVISEADRQVAKLADSYGRLQILGSVLQALTTVPGTEVALYSPESIREEWRKGDLKSSDVFNSLPWTTPLVQFSAPREELGKVAAELNLHGLDAWNSDKHSVQVKTSDYFAELLGPRLGIAKSDMNQVAGSEVDYLIDQFASNPWTLDERTNNWNAFPLASEGVQ